MNRVKISSGPLLVLCALAISCEGGGGDAGPGAGAPPTGYTILDSGQGPTNQAPLIPRVVGIRRLECREGDMVVAVDEGIAIVDGRQVHRITSNHRTQWEFVRDEGLFVVADSYFGRYATPRLSLPGTVRVGMGWETRDDEGEVAETGQVTGREERTTIYGPSVVWTVEWTTATGVTSRSEFVEGAGFLRTTLSGSWDTEVWGASVPSDPPDEEPVDFAAAAPLVPALVEGEHIPLAALDARTITAVDHGGTLDVAALGYFRSAGERQLHQTCFTLAPGDEGADTIGADPRLRVSPWDCPVSSPHAAAALVGDADTDWMPRGELGAVPIMPDGGTLGVTLYEDDAGAPRGLWLKTKSRLESWAWLLGTPEAPGPGTDWVWSDRLLARWAFSFWEGPRDHDLMYFLSPPRATGGKLPVAALLTSGNVWHTVFDEDQGFTPPTLQTWAGGTLSVRAGREDREFLVSSPDGVVDRLVVDVDGVHRQRLAVVAVPPGHRVVGAFRTSGFGEPTAGQGLLVLTDDYVRLVPWKVKNSVVGQLWPWLATLPGPAVSRPAPAALTLGVSRDGADGIVCAPPGALATDDDEAWEVGGAPAAALLPTFHDQCRLAIRDVGAATPSSGAGGTVLTARIPGAGDVLLAANPSRCFEPGVRDRRFPSGGGGFVSGVHSYDDLGVLVETNPWITQFSSSFLEHEGDDDTIIHGVGQGAWWTDKDYHVLVRLDDAPWNLEDPDHLFGIFGLVEGGGVLVSHSGAWIFGVDGAETPVDLSFGYFPAQQPYAVLASGEICGTVSSNEVGCGTGSGQLRAGSLGTWETEFLFGPLPLGDGALLFSRPAYGTVRFDTVTMTPTLLSSIPFVDYTYDADGAAWVASETGDPWRITATDFETLDLPRPPDGAAITRLVPGAEVILVETDAGPYRVMRAPNGP